MSGNYKGEVEINSQSALISVRKVLRELTESIGFGITDITRIITAASELVRNVLIYAESGVMYWILIKNSEKIGIELVFKDSGPGISDIEKAMIDGFSTGKGLGKGLSGVKRLMDEMEISSEVGKGTYIRIKKWLKIKND